MNKRILNLLLAMVLIISLLPLAAFAAESSHVHAWKDGYCDGCRTQKACVYGHNFKNVSSKPGTIPHTCTSSGYTMTYKNCKNCGIGRIDNGSYRQNPADPAAHNWVDSYYGSRKCDVCQTKCGTDGKAHDWSNRDGICKNCGKTCVTHNWTNKDGKCKTCGKLCVTHDWTNKDGKCKTCGKPCGTHDWTNKDGKCKTCGKPCGEHTYNTVPGQTYKQCDCGATCGKDSNHVFGMPTVTPGSCTENGEQIDTCTTCGYEKKTTIPGEHNWVDDSYGIRYCSVCFDECGTYPKWHDWTNNDGVCKYCGKTCANHDWTSKNGNCNNCGEPCFTHDWTDKNGECKICGKACPKHDWSNNDGICAKCGMPCEHEKYTDAVCDECGIRCEHEAYELVEGEYWCSECGVKCAHAKYENGACAYCKMPCAHTNTDHGDCTDCGRKCTHDNWRYEAKDEPTCTKTGVTYGKECPDCGYVFYGRVEIPALGHSFENGICSTCKEECEHTWTNGVCGECEMVCPHDWSNNDSTCADCGTVCSEHDWSNKDSVCGTCGKECGEHDWANLDGICAVCGKECGEHDWANEDGLCANCGFTCKHANKEEMPGYAATCTTEGRNPGKKCSDCGKVLKSLTRIAPLDHEYDETATPVEIVLAPTCEARGIVRHKCIRCPETKKFNVDPIGHKYDKDIETVLEPTCTGKGIVRRECSNCKDIKKFNVDPLGHDMEEYLVREAGCTSVGHIFRACTRCELVETERVQPKGHTEVTVDGVEPTCTATGLTEGKMCSECEEILDAQEVIPMADHNMETVNAVEATCTEDGHNEYKKCSGCDRTEGYQVIKAAHKFDGYKCSECDVYNCDHKGAVIKVTESTCTDHGSKSFFCNTCKYEYMEPELPLAEHEYENKSVAPTCTSAGVDRYVCKGCGDVKGTGTIPALPHNYVNGQCTSCHGNTCAHTNTSITHREPAACDKAGYETVVCDDCHKTLPSNILDAPGHKYGDDGFCSVCGKANFNRFTFDYQDIYFVN